MGMEFDARCDDGNVACLAAMPLVDVLCYVRSGNAADDGDATCLAAMPLIMAM